VKLEILTRKKKKTGYFGEKLELKGKKNNLQPKL
jgi:hypothetical protein